MSNSTDRPSLGETPQGNFNSTHSVSRELYSLLDAVDSESIADHFEIGKHSSTHDFDNHIKPAVREGLDPSSSLAELADKTETDEQAYEIDTDDGGVELHCAARVDGEHKHPLGTTVTEGDTHESPQFDHLKDDIEVFTDLDSIIWVFDRGYTRYLRFCEIKHSDDDFVTLLQSDARLDVLERVQNVEVTDENGTRQIRDERIELAETGEEFRRIVFETPDGEGIEYLTTLASSAYDPIDVISIYTLRTVIEILFRELKQYLNIENFHTKSPNGVLFELFAALIGLVLIYWLRQRHPVKGCVPRTIQKVRTHWNRTLDSFG